MRSWWPALVLLAACGGAEVGTDANVRIADAGPDAASGTLAWVTTGGALGAWAGSFGTAANAVAIERDGNVIVGGSTSGAMFIGSRLVPPPPGWIPPLDASFLLRLDGQSGKPILARQLGLRTRITDLKIDGNGDIVIDGPYTTTTDLGGGSLPESPQDCLFVAKLHGRDLSYAWARGFCATGGASASPGASIALSTTNDPIIVGYFAGTLGLDATSLSSSGSSFLVRMDGATGLVQWARSFPAYRANITTVSSQILMVGLAGIGVVLDGHPLPDPDQLGTASIFAAGADETDGHFAWASWYGSRPSAWAIAATPRDAVLRWGQYLLAVTPPGNVEWMTRLTYDPEALARDSGGGVLAGGEFYTGYKNNDGVVASYDAAGSLRWSSAITGPGEASVHGVASAGRAIACGSFEGNAWVGTRAIRSIGPYAFFCAAFAP